MKKALYLDVMFVYDIKYNCVAHNIPVEEFIKSAVKHEFERRDIKPASAEMIRNCFFDGAELEAQLGMRADELWLHYHDKRDIIDQEYEQRFGMSFAEFKGDE